MTVELRTHRAVARQCGIGSTSLTIALAAISVAGCASSSMSASAAPSPIAVTSSSAPSPDPRVGLSPGWFNAGQAIWNLRLVSSTPPSSAFVNMTTPGDRRLVNSDLAFSRNYVYQGNYSGYQVWDISNPSKPTVIDSYVCPGSQSDVSVYRNLLFVSGEATNGRIDCGMEGVPDTVSKERLRGIRVFDVSDVRHPKYVANVQTCRGSHTHTVVTDPNDPSNIYIYVSGSAPIRSPSELPGCTGASPDEDANSELFRIEVIQVPLAHPEQAHIVSKPSILSDLGTPAKHAENAQDLAVLQARAANRPPRPAGGPVQCHDITVYPAIGLAGGACGGYGLLLDIHDPAHPMRIGAAADSNFSFWHSATFNNDGTKVLFSDEWGGGTQPRCRVTDRKEWGADAIFTLDADRTMHFQSYYKMPAAQTPQENCVAHNGSLIPVPGRDIMVQAWYQGGLSIFDWTDPAHPNEIAFFDRGPMSGTQLVDGGYWSTYWYNGYIIGSEISRGLDVFELMPNANLTQNEIDAAKLVRFDHLNVQDQPKIVWPASFVVARAYLDQLERDEGLSADLRAAVASALATAEGGSGEARRSALTSLASQLDGDAGSASDAKRVRMLADVVRALAAQ